MSGLTHTVISVEAEINLEELAEQLVEQAHGLQSPPLTDSDLLEFILHIVANVNSEHLDKGLHEAIGEFIEGHEHDAWFFIQSSYSTSGGGVG